MKIQTKSIATISVYIIFLALIRSIMEPFRLDYVSEIPVTVAQIKPFLWGAFVSAAGLLTMVTLQYYGKYKAMIASCILTIGVMLVLKFTLLP